MTKTHPSKIACAPFLALAFVIAAAVAAGAAPQIVAPGSGTYTVQTDANGKLAPIAVTVKGYTPGQQVYIEQCDGLAITDPHWTPAIDCDVGTSPAPVFTPPSGTVVFDPANVNHRFTPVKGLSPQGNFACFATTSGKPGVPAFPTCKVRISTDNSQATTDQVFFDLAPPGTHASSSSSSSTLTIVLVIAGAVVLVLLGGLFVVRRRPRAT